MKIYIWIVFVYLFVINLNTIKSYGGFGNVFTLFSFTALTLIVLFVTRLLYEMVVSVNKAERYSSNYIKDLKKVFVNRGFLFTILSVLAGIIGLVTFIKISSSFVLENWNSTLPLHTKYILAPLPPLLLGLLMQKLRHNTNISIYKSVMLMVTTQGMIIYINMFTLLFPVFFIYIFVAFIIYFQAAVIVKGSDIIKTNPKDVNRK